MTAQPGVVIGVVDDLNDPEGLGRVMVTFPHLADEPSNWARLALPMAGAGRGTFFRPEKGDEVLVACEHGDIRQPYVVGSLWSKTDQPPDQTGAATDNNIRVIVSRSGHRITLDDTSGSERIEITDHAGNQAVRPRRLVHHRPGRTLRPGDRQGFGGRDRLRGGNLNLTATGTVKITGAQVTIN